MEFIVIVVIILVFVVLVPLGIAQSRQTNEAWASAARQLGLRYYPASFLRSRQIVGTLQGFSITVDTYTVRSGKNNSTTYTRFRLNYPLLGLGLKLKEEGFFTGITKLFGAQDIPVNDAAFDAGILVKGGNPQRVREFLTPARRMRIHQFLRSHSGATIDDREIFWRTHGVIRDASRLVHIIKSFVRLAWHLTGEREDDLVLDRALEAQDEGRPAEALEVLQNFKPSAQVSHGSDQETFQPDPVEERLLESELLYLADRQEEAKNLFQKVHEAEPDDPNLAAWAGQAAEAHWESSLADTNLEAQAVCRDLFDGEKMSFQISRQFEERYAGQMVRWSGLLRRAESYSFELVFGNQPGCKGVISLCELESTGYANQTVSAIVQFPKDEWERLRGREDQIVTFEGQLKKVDALLRNLYITGGKLVG